MKRTNSASKKNVRFIKGKRKKDAFKCVHNSCRSQIAEALGKQLASDVPNPDIANTINF